jgi:hypothetical protein
MFIELPHVFAAMADPAPELPADFEGPLTMTAPALPRGSRARSGSRIRIAIARDGRQWPSHASVAAGPAFELTFTP